jgi:peptidoglycan/LPS O-acetylase OafA/YrhL
MQRVNKLDGLRGIFSLLVVLFHLNKNNAPLFVVDNFFVRESYIFVDFFFILSGYVISLSYNDRINTQNDFITFIKKRIIRLYPLLLFSTLMYWYFVHPIFNEKNILLALDTLLFTNATPILGSGIGMNYPSWSISSELLSYLGFGMVSLLAMKSNKTIIIGILTLICFIILGFQHNYFATGDYGFIRGLSCFNLGYLVFIAATKQYKIHNNWEWLIPICIIALMYFHFTIAINNQIIQFLVQLLIPFTFAASIFVLINTNGVLSKLLQGNHFLFLGKISYSIYLNHAFVIGFGVPKLFKLISINEVEMKKSICLLLLLVLLIVYSSITQYFIENKLGKKLS